MSEKSRYYWMKLRTDFFNKEEIDYLMSQENGFEYVVLYQMLCLKAANTEGALVTKIGSVEVPVDIKKIVRDSRYSDYQTVKNALEVFKNIGLIHESKDGVMIINGMEDMVGSESAGKSAERMRRMRSKQNQAEKDVTESDVTSVTNCDIDRRDRESREIDKREEEYKYIDIRDIDDREEENREEENREEENREEENRQKEKKKEENKRKENKYAETRDREREDKSPETECQDGSFDISALSRQELSEYREVTEAFNSICLSLAPVSTITKKRLEKLRIIREKYGSCFNYENFFRRVEDSDFLTGRNGNWYSGNEKKANFDWILKCENIEKIQSGNYDNHKSQNNFYCKIPGFQSSYTSEREELLSKIGINL